MDDPLCRVSIQCAGQPTVVDLALPRHAEVGLLLPDIVDLVGAAEASLSAPQGWRLDRLRGGRCDESMTLHESGIADGEVVVLSPVGAPQPGPLHEDPFRTVSDTAAGTGGATPAGFWTCSGLIALSALGYAGIRGGAPWVAAGTALIGAAICVIAAWRRDSGCSAFCGSAVGFVCLAGFLVVPGGPAAPGVALGAAAGGVASVWLLRTPVAQVWLLTGTATVCALVAAVTALSVAVQADLVATGAALGVLSVAVLGGAGRIALVLTGLRPPVPGDGIAPVSPAAAAAGRAVFTGLVTGSAATTAVAAGAVAAGALGDARWPLGFASAAVLSALLLLRIRLYADAHCRLVLGWCSLGGAAAAVALATASAPRYAGPAVALAVALACWCRGAPGRRAASWARGGDLTEYVLLAAVVPLACWAFGLYELVRSLSLR